MASRASDGVRVVVCDDHALFRRGLVRAPDETSDLEVVAEAAGGVEAVESASALAPDVVLMDLRMPGVDGIDATRLLVDAIPTTRILMLAVSDSDEDLFEAIKAIYAEFVYLAVSDKLTGVTTVYDADGTTKLHARQLVKGATEAEVKHQPVAV